VIGFLKLKSSRSTQNGPLDVSEAFVRLLTRRNLSMLAESLAALALGIAINIWLDSSDPLGIKGDFPWIWLIPATFTLRYGSLVGLVQTFALVVIWFEYHRFFGPANLLFPKQFFLGGFVLCLVLGQYSDVFRSRNLKTKEANDYLEDRLRSITRQHYLVRLSHQRLEHELLVKPVTLRDSLESIVPLAQVDAGTLTQAQALLSLIAHNCEVESATIFGAEDGVLLQTPQAHIGEEAALDTFDPLIFRALFEKQLIHVRSEQATVFASKYLVAAPIVSSEGTLLGMLVVTNLPFLALNFENLQLMTVMLGYYADALLASESIRPIKLVFPTCPPDFALEVVRAKRLYDIADIESSLVAIRIPQGAENRHLFDYLQRTRRQTDFAWDFNTPEEFIRILLMPLASYAAIEGLMQRMETDLRTKFQLDFTTARITTHFKAIDRVEVIWTLDDLLHLCKLNIASNYRRTKAPSANDPTPSAEKASLPA
jgi:polysaccharide biosynthesis protein PelD